MIFYISMERGPRMNQRPSEEEYSGDFGGYIQLVPEGNIIDILFTQEKQMTELLASLTESQGSVLLCGREMDIERATSRT